MPSLFLRTVCLVLTATRLTMTETAVCSDGWIYYPHSNKCLQTQYTRLKGGLTDSPERQCSRSRGGEFSNSTGSVVDPTEMETFLTDFLRFQNIRRVIVRLPQTHIRDHWRYREPHFREYVVMMLIASRYEIVDYDWNHFHGQVVCSVDSNVSESQNSSCPTNIKVEDVTENNITLFLKPGPIKSKLVIKVMSFKEYSQTRPIFRKTETIQEYAIFPSKELNFTVKELQTSTQYSFTFEAEGRNKTGIPCKQTVCITTKGTQNSSCPTNLNVEDVTEDNITLFLKPGPIKSKLVIKLMSFEECSQTQPNCRKTETIQEYAIFPSKELNFTVNELQNSTQYSITFEAEGPNKKGIPGKQTVNITTKAKATHNEELNPMVICLSVGLALSILGIAVLAFLYFRLHRQMQNGNNSLHLKSKQTEGSSLKVGFKSKKAMSPFETVSTSQSSSRYGITIKKNEGVGEYSNMPATAPNDYDQARRDIDEHFYDMT